MRSINTFLVYLGCCSIFLINCYGPAPSGGSLPSESSQVILQNEQDNYQIIREFELDNCDGKAEASRSESQSSSIDVSISNELAAQIGGSIQVISADVQITVGSALNISSERVINIELKAPPQTHMVFQLAWIGKLQEGTVQNVKGSGIPVPFQTFIPFDVKINKQSDVGCLPLNQDGDITPTVVINDNPIEATKEATPISNPIQIPNNVCPLVIVEGTISGLPIMQTKTWAELAPLVKTNEPQSTNINDICSRVSDNFVQVWIGYWSADPNYLAFRGTMRSDEAISLVNQNPGQPVLIIPWGE